MSLFRKPAQYRRYSLASDSAEIMKFAFDSLEPILGIAVSLKTGINHAMVN